MTEPGRARVVILGAGPAGLWAAETLSARSVAVCVIDQKPSAGRKFLVAGKGGLNLTHSEPLEIFASRYGPEAERFSPWLEKSGPSELCRWAESLGVTTFVGTSGRVFPEAKQAAPLLRRWMMRLRRQGVEFQFRTRWCGLARSGKKWTVQLESSEVECDAVLLALGGGSWPGTGSDGNWVSVLRELGVQVNPLVPSNCGWNVDWPAAFIQQFEGTPWKNVRVRSNGVAVEGELLITRDGLEGGALYQVGAVLRAQENPVLEIDFKPGLTVERLLEKYHATGTGRWQRRVTRAWNLSPSALAWLEGRNPEPLPEILAGMVKHAFIPLRGPRPIAEAISSAGGIAWPEMEEGLMFRRLPGIFAAGEMLDWDAPTGGYLLTGCWTTAQQASSGVLMYLATSA